MEVQQHLEILLLQVPVLLAGETMEIAIHLAEM